MFTGSELLFKDGDPPAGLDGVASSDWLPGLSSASLSAVVGDDDAGAECDCCPETSSAGTELADAIAPDNIEEIVSGRSCTSSAADDTSPPASSTGSPLASDARTGGPADQVGVAEGRGVDIDRMASISVTRDTSISNVSWYVGGGAARRELSSLRPW